MIDKYLFDKVFQPISNMFQKTTGLTCFFLAYFCRIADISLSLICKDNANPKNYADAAIGIFVCAIFIESLRIQAKIASQRKCLSWAKASKFLFLVRYLIIMFTSAVISAQIILLYGFGDLKSLLLIIGNVFHLAHYYFACCTPLPPGQSAFDALFKKLFAPSAA